MPVQYASLCHDPMLPEIYFKASGRLSIINSSLLTKMVSQASLLCQLASSDCSHKCNNKLEISRGHPMRRQCGSAFNLTQCMDAQMCSGSSAEVCSSGQQHFQAAVISSTGKQQCSAAAGVPF